MDLARQVDSLDLGHGSYVDWQNLDLPKDCQPWIQSGTWFYCGQARRVYLQCHLKDPPVNPGALDGPTQK